MFASSKWIPLCLLLLGSPSLLRCVGEEFTVEARLVWGTNQPKPAGSSFAPLDDLSRDKVRPFKWTNYWVVNTVLTAVPRGNPKLVPLSPKCAVDVNDLGNGNVEIRLFELKEGAAPKLVKPVQHSLAALRKGEYCILAGDDKKVWDDAWFVILTRGR
ncbi:MAG: hypothetical protein KF791_05630 [Verrucomicrobiae bacterium]|nr:hypothetical protein [Verrucomicrobiae bacterium]